ncbi:hypothetical protein POTOM_053717 [Populus tomentosa]|uniref:COP9 signalosome complex subunit 3 N-terminal helical repeats domain-containing protein n=1 Tax=Populus tomentosa TaxID=118781 RepID=A0A8X7XXW0_POPTO|nr:hypothetical protein POTOM_053717 [Populus tomentosa]
MSKREDWFSSFPVIAVSKRFKDQVLMLEVPMRGVAPLLEAVKKLRSSSEHLTALHPDFLQLCLLGDAFVMDDFRTIIMGHYIFLVWVSFAGAGIGAASYWVKLIFSFVYVNFCLSFLVFLHSSSLSPSKPPRTELLG